MFERPILVAPPRARGSRLLCRQSCHKGVTPHAWRTGAAGAVQDGRHQGHTGGKRGASIWCHTSYCSSSTRWIPGMQARRALSKTGDIRDPLAPSLSRSFSSPMQRLPSGRVGKPRLGELLTHAVERQSSDTCCPAPVLVCPRVLNLSHAASCADTICRHFQRRCPIMAACWCRVWRHLMNLSVWDITPRSSHECALLFR